MIEVYTFRHPETDWNREKRFQGRVDIPLNETGLRQAEEIATQVQDIPFTHLISSELRRSLQFAEKVARGRDLEIIVDRNLTERALGIFEGLLYDSHPGGQVTALKSEEFEGGEPLASVYARAARIPQDLRKYGDGAVIGLFTHGCLMAPLPAALQKEPYDPEKAELPPNGGCHYFQLNKEGELLELRLNYQLK